MEEGHLERGQAVVVMTPADDVATALRELVPGERVSYRVGQRADTVEVRARIPFGHKVALRDLAEGDAVHKYGAVIGRTTAAVRAGEHVHVHNLSGVRGRGDLAATRGDGTHAPEG